VVKVNAKEFNQITFTIWVLNLNFSDIHKFVHLNGAIICAGCTPKDTTSQKTFPHYRKSFLKVFFSNFHYLLKKNIRKSLFHNHSEW